MRRWYTQAAIFILICLVADRIAGYGLQFISAGQKSGQEWIIKERLLNQQPTIAILGSSRAVGHYNDLLISKELGTSCINYGIQGSGIQTQWVITDIISRNNPRLKTIILDLKPGEFEDALDYTELKKLSHLTPYSHVLDSLIKNQLPYEKVKRMLSHTYEYNNRIFDLAKGYLISSKLTPEMVSGYEGFPCAAQISSFSTMSFHALDTTYIRILEHLYRICEQKKINLKIVISPIYAKVHQSKSIPIIEAFCKAHQIPFFNFSNQKDFMNHPEYFKDEYHLCTTGAELYTKMMLPNL